MTAAIKRFGLLIMTSTVVCLPAALLVKASDSAPLWYLFLSAVFAAFGIGLFATVLGGIALFAARGRPDGGVKTALGIATVTALFSSYAVIAPAVRH